MHQLISPEIFLVDGCHGLSWRLLMLFNQSYSPLSKPPSLGVHLWAVACNPHEMCIFVCLHRGVGMYIGFLYHVMLFMAIIVQSSTPFGPVCFPRSNDKRHKRMRTGSIQSILNPGIFRLCHIRNNHAGSSIYHFPVPVIAKHGKPRLKQSATTMNPYLIGRYSNSY